METTKNMSTVGEHRKQKTGAIWTEFNAGSTCDLSKMFRCTTGGHCIFKRYVCDGKADCKDQSDEHFFKYDLEIRLLIDISSCNPEVACVGRIRCSDGRCIDRAACCDPRIDSGCVMRARTRCCDEQYQSAYGMNVSNYFICNRKKMMVL